MAPLDLRVPLHVPLHVPQDACQTPLDPRMIQALDFGWMILAAMEEDLVN